MKKVLIKKVGYEPLFIIPSKVGPVGFHRGSINRLRAIVHPT